MTRHQVGDVSKVGQVDGAKLDDTTIAQRALTNDPVAWAALIERCEKSIRIELARALKAGEDVLCSDSVDEALGDFWVRLLQDDRAWLRRYDPTRGYALTTWLSALAWDVGNKHVRKLRRWRKGLPMDGIDLDMESWNPRGLRFASFLETIQPDEEKKPFFKWR